MATTKLDGFTVAVTAHRRADEQAQLLRRHGARVLHGPVLQTRPLVDDAPLRAATESLLETPPDLVVANTAVGMRGWLDAAEAWGYGDALAELLRGVDVVARGPKAAGSLAPIGATVSWKAPTGQLRDLLAHVATRIRCGQRIAFQRDGSASAAPKETLESFGAEVVELPIYEWTRPADDAPALRLLDAVCNGAVDAVTFTSRPAVDSLAALAAETGRRDQLDAAFAGNVAPVCVGPVCLDAARAQGFARAAAPQRPLLGAMVSAVVDALAGRATVRTLATGHRLVLQGAVALVDDHRVELSARETAVLRALARRSGAVASKRALLGEVWSDDATDEHTLEVTISRLRRRLGAAGPAIGTVVRRGYRLSLAP